MGQTRFSSPAVRAGESVRRSDRDRRCCCVVRLNGVADRFRGRGLRLLMQIFLVRDMPDREILYAKVLTGPDEGHAPRAAPTRKRASAALSPTGPYRTVL